MGLNWGVFGGNALGGFGQGLKQGQDLMSGYQNYQQQGQMNPLLLQQQQLQNQRIQQQLQAYPQQQAIWEALARFGLGVPPGSTSIPGGGVAGGGTQNAAFSPPPMNVGNPNIGSPYQGNFFGLLPQGMGQPQNVDPMQGLLSQYLSMFGV